MKATKQPKDAGVNDVAKSRMLQAKRDLAWQVYCAVHDEFESFEYAERRAVSLAKDVVRVVNDMHNVLSDLVRSADENQQRAREARTRFDRIAEVWGKLDRQARAAGIPDPTEDFAAVLEHIDRAATLRLGGDTLTQLSRQLSDMSRAPGTNSTRTSRRHPT